MNCILTADLLHLKIKAILRSLIQITRLKCSSAGFFGQIDLFIQYSSFYDQTKAPAPLVPFNNRVRGIHCAFEETARGNLDLSSARYPSFIQLDWRGYLFLYTGERYVNYLHGLGNPNAFFNQEIDRESLSSVGTYFFWLGVGSRELPILPPEKYCFNHKSRTQTNFNLTHDVSSPPIEIP